MNTSVYDQLGATPASTTVSTDTKAAGNMLNLSMGPLEQPAPHKPSDSDDKTDALSDYDQLEDMFKIPVEAPVHQDPTPAKPQLNPWGLMAEAQYKFGWRTLPLPPVLRRVKDNLDSQNIVLQAIQMPKVADTPVEVTSAQNRDLLDLNQDASWDAALKSMQDRCRRESHSSSTGSQSNSSKHHQSGSHSKDEADSKKGRQTPTEDQNRPAPVEGTKRWTLDWSQDILEPRKQIWRLAAGDAAVIPRQTLKSVVNPLEKPAPVAREEGAPLLKS